MSSPPHLVVDLFRPTPDLTFLNTVGGIVPDAVVQVDRIGTAGIDDRCDLVVVLGLWLFAFKLSNEISRCHISLPHRHVGELGAGECNDVADCVPVWQIVNTHHSVYFYEIVLVGDSQIVEDRLAAKGRDQHQQIVLYFVTCRRYYLAFIYPRDRNVVVNGNVMAFKGGLQFLVKRCAPECRFERFGKNDLDTDAALRDPGLKLPGQCKSRLADRDRQPSVRTTPDDDCTFSKISDPLAELHRGA